MNEVFFVVYITMVNLRGDFWNTLRQSLVKMYGQLKELKIGDEPDTS
jgi:hypothetical protein